MTTRVRASSWAVLCLALGCTPKGQQSEPVDQEIAVNEAPPVSSPAPARPSPAPESQATPREVADDQPLSEGLVSFKGMLRGTKGGFDVRGVIFEGEELRQALPEGARSLKDSELLGAKLQVVAELRSHHAEPQSPDEPQVQTRSGDWLSPTRVISIEIAKPAVMIEGVVGRSKGLFTVGNHMVTREDLDWPFKGADVVGKKVRLWGQPRTYVCPPQAQCLISGEIPMFDVARGELP